MEVDDGREFDLEKIAALLNGDVAGHLTDTGWNVADHLTDTGEIILYLEAAVEGVREAPHETDPAYLLKVVEDTVAALRRLPA